MERWHETPGMPWLHRGLVDPAPDAHLAGVVLGRGYAHQPVRDLGVATAVAGVLVRELSGPVETGTGQVTEVRAQVDVDLQDTLVLLSGTEEALRQRLSRLAALLDDPESADLTPPTERVGHPYAGASREVAAWFGAGPASLSCHIDPAGAVAADALASAMRALHPASGTPVAGFTTLEPLVGTVFPGPVSDGPPDALHWRRPGPGSLTDGAPTALVSLSAERSTAGGAAQRLLLDLLRDALRLSGVGVTGLRMASTTVGDRRFAVLHAVPSDQGFDRVEVHRAVVQALDAGRELAPGRVQQALYAMREEEVRAARTHPVALLLETLRSGVEQRSADMDAALEATTPDDVGHALRRLLDGLVVNEPPRAETPMGYPVLTPVPEPPAGSPDSIHRARFATRLGEGGLQLTRAEVHGDRLLTFARPVTGHGGKERVADAVDLTRLAARFDQGEPGGGGTTTLVDEDDHRVVLPWAALARRGSLRAVVDRAAPAERVLALPPDPGWLESLGHHRRRTRRVLMGVAAFLVVVGVVLLAVALSRPDDDPTTVTDVAFGEDGTLSNGTRIQVSELRAASGGSGQGPLRLADVRFCAGGPTEVDGVQESARNYISPARFRLEGTPNNTLTANPPGVELLREATLAEGDCLEGVIGFQVPPDTPEVGVAVNYTNGLGDQLTWR